MEKRHQYETSVEWSGRLTGSLTAPGLPGMTVGSPPDFGGEGGVWTPEHFVVASTNTCVMLTFLVIAQFSKLDVAAWSSSARGTVEKVEGQGYMFTGIEIEARIRVRQGSDVERAERLVQKAEKSCLVSRSLKAAVTLRAQITVADV